MDKLRKQVAALASEAKPKPLTLAHTRQLCARLARLASKLRSPLDTPSSRSRTGSGVRRANPAASATENGRHDRRGAKASGRRACVVEGRETTAGARASGRTQQQPAGVSARRPLDDQLQVAEQAIAASQLTTDDRRSLVEHLRLTSKHAIDCTLSELLKARIAAGLSLGQASRLLGVTSHYLHNVEHGAITPTAELLSAMDRVYRLGERKEAA